MSRSIWENIPVRDPISVQYATKHSSNRATYTHICASTQISDHTNVPNVLLPLLTVTSSTNTSRYTWGSSNISVKSVPMRVIIVLPWQSTWGLTLVNAPSLVMCAWKLSNTDQCYWNIRNGTTVRRPSLVVCAIFVVIDEDLFSDIKHFILRKRNTLALSATWVLLSRLSCGVTPCSTPQGIASCVGPVTSSVMTKQNSTLMSNCNTVSQEPSNVHCVLETSIENITWRSIWSNISSRRKAQE